MITLRLISVIATCLCFSAPSFAITHSNKSVSQLQSTWASADCIFFTLDGVSEADPVKPGNTWFAIDRTQFGAKDAYAMLLSAKISGTSVTVRTSGTLACGWASVESVIMQ